MSKRILLLLAVALAGCSSTSPKPVSLGDDGAENLDRSARMIAQTYREKCYEPVRKRKVPDDLCQYQLFEMAERQFGSGFGKTDLMNVANRILGDQIEKEVTRLLLFDKASQRYVANSFKNRSQMISTLREKYSIRQ